MKVDVDMNNPQFRTIITETAKMAVQEYRKQSEMPTLRDQFAMAALTGILSAEANPSVQTVIEPTNRGNVQYTANFAYILADAMLKERSANET